MILLPKAKYHVIKHDTKKPLPKNIQLKLTVLVIVIVLPPFFSVAHAADYLDTSNVASRLVNYSNSVSSQSVGSYHPYVYNFKIGSSLFTAGFCAELNDYSPEAGDEYSSHLFTRQSQSNTTIDYLSSLYKEMDGWWRYFNADESGISWK